MRKKPWISWRIVLKRTCFNDKIACILELLAIPILGFQLLTASFSSTGTHPAFLVFTEGLTLCLVILRLPFHSLQKLSGSLLLVCGLVAIVLDPLDIAGVLLTVFALFVGFSNGFFHQTPGLKIFTFGALIFGLQTASILLNPSIALSILVHDVVIDVVLVILIYLSRHELYDGLKADDPQKRHPVLNLSEYKLTPREVQIVHLIWGGLTPKEIAFDLEVSESTVRKTLTLVYRKLGVEGAPNLIVLNHTHRVVVD